MIRRTVVAGEALVGARTAVAMAALGMAALGMAALGAMIVGCAGPLLAKTPGVDPRRHVLEGQVDLGAMRFAPDLCAGVDLTPDYGVLDEAHVMKFLEKQGIAVDAARARTDLVYIQLRAVPQAEPVRLRVAILPNAAKAGEELHQAILEHGSGWWGVHRANLAILGPEGPLDDIVAFVSRTKLACWGVVTVAGQDDAFVIPGAYREI